VISIGAIQYTQGVVEGRAHKIIVATFKSLCMLRDAVKCVISSVETVILKCLLFVT